MLDLFFVAALAASAFLLFGWAFRTLPHEGWQILAAVPTSEIAPREWQGVNLTYYGALLASAMAVSLVICLVLLAAVGMSVGIAAALVGLILPICVPAAKAMAIIVERKRHTFTVGGASFLGILCAPIAVWMLDHASLFNAGSPVPVVTVLAVLSIAYAMGEGLGRLACISFGCCYGRPLAECSDRVQRLLRGRAFVFSGKTKKISYESGLDGNEVVPVQALTSVICTTAGLVGILLYLRSFHCTAFVLTIGVTQTWRALSESMRADYRGSGRISAYQVMAVASMLYAMGWAWLLPAVSIPAANLRAGLAALWDPAVIISLQALWLLVFLYTGRSAVTGATLSFHVHRDRV
ncbi:MAG: prolipoprotein diacylglyceryl transferase [Desulfomonile sp.]|nr:prolipoprotein diacylglyceryl transferase [Desulfomonile sp.]